MSVRTPQLNYSEIQKLMLDEPSRRAKAAKMTAVIEHFLGREDLNGLQVADIGCSGGIIADEMRSSGACVIGLDIDVSGLRRAQTRFGGDVDFVCASSERMPFADSSMDVMLCNHVYEHVVSQTSLFAELRRVVKPSGVIYLGLGNRFGVIEPHYRLPFLSWLPRRLAHVYVRLAGRADSYHEAFTTRGGLKRLCVGFEIWDYTYTILAEPARFSAVDVMPRWLRVIPTAVLRLTQPIMPTYIWMASRELSVPRGPRARVPPLRVRLPWDCAASLDSTKRHRRGALRC